jgi:uncharacterized protein YegJ (DUF2314 family)
MASTRSVLSIGLAAAALLCGAGCDKGPKADEAAFDPAPAKKVVTSPRASLVVARPWPSGTLVEAPIVIEFAVYALPDGTEDVLAAAKAVRASDDAKLPRVIEGDPPSKIGLRIHAPPIDKYAPPDPEALKYFGRGLSEAQAAGVQRSPKVVVLTFTADAANADKIHAAALTMVAAVAKRSGGLIWDEMTREVFSRSAWERRLEKPLSSLAAAIAFPGPPGSLHERQNQLVSTLFGTSDSVVQTTHDDAILAASAAARAKLERLKPRFAEGAPDMETLLVKGPFKTPTGGEEWMWIEVTRWTGATISGILQNDPFHIPDLQAGAKVEVTQASVFDYLYKKKDGTTEGNETAKLIKPR